MPTIFREKGYRGSFFLFDLREPMHVHVFKGKGTSAQQCKVWVESLQVAWNHGFTAHEIREILKIVANNREKIATEWKKKR